MYIEYEEFIIWNKLNNNNNMNEIYVPEIKLTKSHKQTCMYVGAGWREVTYNTMVSNRPSQAKSSQVDLHTHPDKETHVEY